MYKRQVTHRAGLQCVLKPRAPSTHRDGSLNHLKHILDSVPFTPSQGVRTPSPRHCMVRFSRLLTQSFVHATTAAAGSELVVHSSSNCGLITSTFVIQFASCCRMPHKATPSSQMMPALLQLCTPTAVPRQKHPGMWARRMIPQCEGHLQTTVCWHIATEGCLADKPIRHPDHSQAHHTK